jgi:hypothetical protein
MLKLFAWLMVVSSLALGLDQAVIVDKLNWQKSNSVCGGNFFQGFSIAAAPAIGEHLTADKVSLADDLQVAKGNVSLVWKNGKVDTDLLSIANMKNGDSLLTANGGVKYESDNDLVVATPELVALDLFKYPDHAGGLNHIATVFSELIETLDPIKLIELAKNTNSECQLQRIGYILDNIDLMDEDNAEITINSLAQHVQKKKPNYLPLASEISKTGYPRCEKWRIIENTEIESDL